jgi:hypothetical protein
MNRLTTTEELTLMSQPTPTNRRSAVNGFEEMRLAKNRRTLLGSSSERFDESRKDQLLKASSLARRSASNETLSLAESSSRRITSPHPWQVGPKPGSWPHGMCVY